MLLIIRLYDWTMSGTPFYLYAEIEWFFPLFLILKFSFTFFEIKFYAKSRDVQLDSNVPSRGKGSENRYY